MATPEALVKYYDCLKDSFNKIQIKDNESALINAALRPNIHEEFVKNAEVLTSYLSYIQIFSSIYSDKFPNVCFSVIAPVFKYEIKQHDDDHGDKTSAERLSDDQIARVHETIKSIIDSKPQLADEFVHSITKCFPKLELIEANTSRIFLSYLGNCLHSTRYLRGASLVRMLTTIIEKLTPVFTETTQEDIPKIKELVAKGYDAVYAHLEAVEKEHLERISLGFFTSYSKNFLTSPKQSNQLNYLILYLCSLKPEFPDLLLNLLWDVFVDKNNPVSARKISVNFSSSLIARANYLDLDVLFAHLVRARAWCNEFLATHTCESSLDREKKSEEVECFYTLFQSILYLITQRCREMYEDETIKRLIKLNIGEIIDSSWKPMDDCDNDIRQRFQEVASLYSIGSSSSYCRPIKKRRISNETERRQRWRAALPEKSDGLPSRIKSIYRDYYDHRNFTVIRE